MDSQIFVVRRAFLLPLGLLFFLILALAIVCYLQGQPRGKIIILTCLMLPVAGLFIESLFRKVQIGAESITVKKFLRQKTVLYSEVTAVDMVSVKKRAFLTLSTEESFVILSNAYRGFADLVRELLPKLPPEAINEETRSSCETVPVKSSDIVSCWLAVGVVLFILYLQIFA